MNHEEREEVLTTCIKLSHKLEHVEESEQLRSGKSLKKGCRLSSLTPFLDEQGALRVGGQTSDYHIEEQHTLAVASS